jgi:protein-S-isoprenylcysteine O-methyltransferase Ste14
MEFTRVSLAGFALAVIALVALLAQGSLLAAGWVGITVQMIAVALMIWARITFGRRSFHATASPTEGGLVTSGPYRFIRHPIYAAAIYLIWAGVLSHLGWLSLLLGLAGSAGFAARMLAEEHLLKEQYPAYLEYASRTRRILPFVL